MIDEARVAKGATAAATTASNTEQRPPLDQLLAKWMPPIPANGLIHVNLASNSPHSSRKPKAAQGVRPTAVAEKWLPAVPATTGPCHDFREVRPAKEHSLKYVVVGAVV